MQELLISYSQAEWNRFYYSLFSFTRVERQKHFIRPRDSTDSLLVKGNEITSDRSYGDRPDKSGRYLQKRRRLVETIEFSWWKLQYTDWTYIVENQDYYYSACLMANVQWFLCFIKI